MSAVATDPEVAAGFETTAVCAMPPGITADAVTADGHAVALIREDGNRYRFLWDGEAGAQFDVLGALRDGSPAVFASADGRHVAYMAARDGRHFVGRDGREGPGFDGLTRSVPPVFSPDGAHLAYGAGAPDDVRLCVDDRVASELPIAPIQAVFSSDGSRLAYVEMRPTTKRGYEVRIVLDGVPGPWFEGMRNEDGVMQFSPDGRRFAYRVSHEDATVHWVVDGVAQRRTNSVVSLKQALRRVAVVEPAVPATFSPDGSRFAYFADVVEKGVAVLEDDVPGPLVKSILGPVFSPDSRHLAYLAQQFDDRLMLVVDGVSGTAYRAQDGGGPWFSPDSRRIAFLVRREEGSIFRRRSINTLVIDGSVVAEVEGDDACAMPAFSPDGTHLAWWVKQGKVARAMVDDRPLAAEGSVESNPTYSASGRLVYAMRTDAGRMTVAVDGRPGPLFDDLAAPQDLLLLFGRSLAPSVPVPFAVSPEGDHVAWMGVADGLARPVLDDRVGPAFDAGLGWSFDADGRATWLAQRGDVVWRVTATP